MKFDYTLYLVTDRGLMSSKTLPEAVEQAILGGCTMVQIREKDISTLEFYKQAADVKKISDKYNVPLIVNDRIDVALAVNAAGVHIGQSDMPAAVAKKIIPSTMLLGVSVSSVREAETAMKDGADYLGVGAMFRTGTKTNAKPVSMEELQKICHIAHIPIVVIGGIHKSNAGLFRFSEIDGVAVVSAIISSYDIKKAAAEIKTAFCGEE